jgi:hypothetical protein
VGRFFSGQEAPCRPCLTVGPLAGSNCKRTSAAVIQQVHSHDCIAFWLQLDLRRCPHGPWLPWAPVQIERSFQQDFCPGCGRPDSALPMAFDNSTL